MSRRDRAGWSLLVSAVIASAPALGGAGELRRDSFASVQVVASVPQGEFALADPSRAGAVREAAPLVEASRGRDFLGAVQAAFGRELATSGRLRGAKLEVTGDPVLDAAGARAVRAAAGTEAVLLIEIRYALSYNLRHVVVTSEARLCSTSNAPRARSQDRSPCPAPYARTFMSSLPAPGWGRWGAGHVEAAMRAVDGGIAEIARMLVWDLEQEEPKGRWNPFGAHTVVHKEYDEDEEWMRIAEENGRAWYRSESGALGSTGMAYLPAPESAVRPAASGGTVQASSYAPASEQHATGAIGSVEIVHLAVRQQEDARAEAAALQRAFGTTETAPSDRPSVAVDRLTNGSTTFAPDLREYVGAALRAELGRMGVTFAAGRPTLRGEIVTARASRSIRSVGATLEIRFALVDPAGTVLYTGTQSVASAPDEEAQSEIEAFHGVLRKLAEGLASDAAFAAAVGGGRP